MNVHNEDLDSDSSQSTIDTVIKSIIQPTINFADLAPRIVLKSRQQVPKSNWWDVVYPALGDRAYKKIHRMKRPTIELLTNKLFDYSNFKSRQECLKAVCVCVNYLATHARQYDLQYRYSKRVPHLLQIVQRII